MRPDYITASLGLPEFHVLGTCESDSLVWIKVVKRNEFALCPECGRVTQHFHDERVDDVWDVPILEKGVKLLVVKRRWGISGASSVPSRLAWSSAWGHSCRRCHCPVGNGSPSVCTCGRAIQAARW